MKNLNHNQQPEENEKMIGKQMIAVILLFIILSAFLTGIGRANEGFERRKEPLFGQVDMQATYKKYAKPSSLICKLRAKTCELCGTTCDDIEIHQVKRLKDLTGNAEWEQIMRSRHRKTLAVCPNCHEMIHRSNKSQDDGKRRAVCAERCLHGSGGSQ